jgi:adenylyltransferase/sulfurtransferase
VSPLSRDELTRYSRHLLLSEIGVAGQQKLKDSRVLVVGVGGLGSPAALYLAAVGVGEIGLVEFDTVHLTNLHRQVLYTTDDVGHSKLAAARERLAALNPDTRIVPYEERFSAQNARRILEPYDVVVDGTDNFPARYLLNDVSAFLGKPYVYGSVVRFEGQLSVFDAKRGPCYRCLYSEPPAPDLIPSCAEAGVLGVVPGIVGVLQATETVKLLLGRGQPLIGRLLLVDALNLSFREFRFRKNPQCRVCAPGPGRKGFVGSGGFPA